MSNNTKDGVVYRRASMASLILSVCVNGGGMCFYLLIGYASYIANVGYGIATAVAGIIITATRIFDGITDPICAAIFDRMKPGKHGKIRLFILLGWAVMSIADVLMFNILADKTSGILGMIIFIALYMVHVIGYTILGIGSGVIGTVITNDPHQRPYLNTIGTIYSYCIPMLLSTVVSFVILPRYNNQFNAACFREISFLFIGSSLILILLACIGVSGVDTAENLSGIAVGNKEKETKVGFKEMWSMLRDNKPMRMWIIAGASDKLAQQTYGQSIVANLMSGVLIASYQVSTLMGNFTMIISIGFAFIGGAFVSKFGAKKATSTWSLISIGVAAINVAFCAFLGPDGMKSVGVFGISMLIYIILQIARNGSNMVLSTANGVMRADITDYELERSGNMLAGTVGAVYSFIDKCISSLGSTIAAVCITFVGYTTTVPQMGDKATWPILWMTMFLMFGLPTIGWICNLFAMKGYELTKERMVEVQKNVAEMKAAAAQKN